MRRTGIVCIALSLALSAGLSVGCGKKKDDGVAAQKPGAGSGSAGAAAATTYPDTTDGLKQELTDFLGTMTSKDGNRARAIMGSLHMTGDAPGWFKATWGDDVGGRLAAEYAAGEHGMDNLQHLAFDLANQGATNVEVMKFEKPDDPEENTYESEALRAMKKPVPLYSARITKPGHHLGTHIWSFAYIDGGFRLVGRLTHLKDGPAPSPEVDAVAQLRLKDAKVYLDTGKLPED